MNDFIRSITPDSVSGAIFALEGIKHSMVLLNGPSGCKYYHSAVSNSQRISQPSFDPLLNPETFFFGQPRVPCTYLDSNDYIYGSADKLEAALAFLDQETVCDCIGIVNSPGAALIGDDIKGIAQRSLPHALCVTVESPGFSLDMIDGYDSALLALLQTLDQPSISKRLSNTVNILGLSIYHRYYKGDREELQRLFELCGIEVNCFVGADCTLDELRRVPEAALNIAIHPEHCANTVAYLEEQYGTPTMCLDMPPVGFLATENLMNMVCEQLGVSYTPFQNAAEKARATAFAYIATVNSMTGLPKGVPVALEGYPLDVLAYAKFLTNYFGMALDCVSLMGTEKTIGREELQRFLVETGRGYALETSLLESSADLVFANASTIAALRQKGRLFCGIETMLPTFGYLDVIPKTHLGLSGALLLTEQVLNGLLF